jgi:hypothetical protein
MGLGRTEKLFRKFSNISPIQNPAPDTSTMQGIKCADHRLWVPPPASTFSASPS